MSAGNLSGFWVSARPGRAVNEGSKALNRDAERIVEARTVIGGEPDFGEQLGCPPASGPGGGIDCIAAMLSAWAC